MTEPLLLDPDAAADRLGLSRTSVYALVRAGRLVAVRPLTGELKFRARDLEAFTNALEPVDPAAVPATTQGAASPGALRRATGSPAPRRLGPRGGGTAGSRR